MRNIRLIGRLDIKGPNLIKGINLEGLRVIGSPNDYAIKYYKQGIDELIFMDCVATLYGRNHLAEIITNASREIFVPITVGGGIRSTDDVFEILRSGADKVAINTAAILKPNIISQVARCFGSQCMVISIEAKKIGPKKWEAYTDNGREKTDLDVVSWAKEAVKLGAGEILLTSVDNEGTRKGFDVSLLKTVANEVSVPVIASGGMGTPYHLIEAVKYGNVDAVAMADILHYERYSVGSVRDEAIKNNINVRSYE